MRLDYPMKKNGMYLLKKTDFEDIACQVLTEYMPSVFNYPRPTDIEYLAQECLYLDIKHEYITFLKGSSRPFSAHLSVM